MRQFENGSKFRTASKPRPSDVQTGNRLPKGTPQRFRRPCGRRGGILARSCSSPPRSSIATAEPRTLMRIFASPQLADTDAESRIIVCRQDALVQFDCSLSSEVGTAGVIRRGHRVLRELRVLRIGPRKRPPCLVGFGPNAGQAGILQLQPTRRFENADDSAMQCGSSEFVGQEVVNVEPRTAVRPQSKQGHQPVCAGRRASEYSNNCA